jgi:hypothetical protein
MTVDLAAGPRQAGSSEDAGLQSEQGAHTSTSRKSICWPRMLVRGSAHPPWSTTGRLLRAVCRPRRPTSTQRHGVHRFTVGLSYEPGITGRKPGQSEISFHLVDDPIISEPECAKYIGVSVITLRRMRKRGEIAFVQVSENRIGYRRSYANRLLDQRTVNATAA